MEKIKSLIKNLLEKIKSNKYAMLCLINFAIVVIVGVLFTAPHIGLATALVGSIVYELYNEYKFDNGWDIKRIVADVIGMLIGIFSIL